MSSTTPSQQPSAVIPAPGPFNLSAWAWVPIRSLAPRHRPRIATHLLALDEHDRYLRFGYPASDSRISLTRCACTLSW